MSTLTRAEIEQTAKETADALYALGHAMIETERWQDATTAFQSMVLLCPRDERSWLALGQCHEAMQQSHAAIELYSFGLLAVPKGIRCRVALVRALRRAGRDDDASAVLDRARELADELDDRSLTALVEKEAA